MQESSHIKSNKKRDFVHPRAPISHRLFISILSASLFFFIANSHAKPLSVRDTAPGRLDASRNANPSRLTASISEIEHNFIGPKSVVKFEVPIRRMENGERRNFIENCSAYAVQKTSKDYLLLSSWHCIDGYQWNRKAPSVKHAGKNVQPTLGESGGNMKQDWLLMTAPRAAFKNSLALTPLASEPVRPGEILHGFGWGGHTQSSRSTPKALTCRAMEVGHRLTLDCGFSKGDSGGLIARRINNGYEAVGIISEGDSSTVTYAYPLSRLPPQVSVQLLTISD